MIKIEMNRNKMIKIEMHGIILCHFNPLRHLDERHVDVKSSKIMNLGLEIQPSNWLNFMPMRPKCLILSATVKILVKASAACSLVDVNSNFTSPLIT